jgi:hypothetical protein
MSWTIFELVNDSGISLGSQVFGISMHQEALQSEFFDQLLQRVAAVPGAGVPYLVSGSPICAVMTLAGS